MIEWVSLSRWAKGSVCGVVWYTVLALLDGTLLVQMVCSSRTSWTASALPQLSSAQSIFHCHRPSLLSVAVLGLLASSRSFTIPNYANTPQVM